MGVLERWDRHNQRILEWHNHLAREGEPRPWTWKKVVAIVLVLGVLRLLGPYLEELIGVGWLIALQLALAVALLAWTFARNRRRRLAWEADARSQAAERRVIRT